MSLGNSSYETARRSMEAARKECELARADWLAVRETNMQYGSSLVLITAAVAYAEAANLRAEYEEQFEELVAETAHMTTEELLERRA